MVTYIPKCVVYANAVPLQRSKKCETVKKRFQKHLKQTAHCYVSEIEWKFQNFCIAIAQWESTLNYTV